MHLLSDGICEIVLCVSFYDKLNRDDDDDDYSRYIVYKTRGVKLHGRRKA